MFYSAQILSRKGPLGTCWLASWSQRGLKRSEVFNCSLPAAEGEHPKRGATGSAVGAEMAGRAWRHPWAAAAAAAFCNARPECNAPLRGGSCAIAFMPTPLLINPFSFPPPHHEDSIINPEAPLALRLSGQLLLGLVRLYLRRLQFLEEDAGLALRGLARVGAAARLRARLRP